MSKVIKRINNIILILESVIISKVPSIQDMTTEIRVELTTTIDILPNDSIMDILCKSFFNNPDQSAFS